MFIFYNFGYNIHESEQTPGDSVGQGSLVCCSPWGHRESDTTYQLNNNNNSLFQLYLISSNPGIGLDYCDIEWFALETNRDHSVVFEIASKYCISDSFVDHDGYSIYSKGFLPTVVDMMVI